MKKLIAILIILILIPYEIHACDCGIYHLSELQKMEMENSECIFIGEIIKVNKDLTYQIRVTESLDGGDSKGNIYIGQNNKMCEPYVSRNGKWIVYAKMDNGFLKMNTCGISRSFDYPIVNAITPSRDLSERKLTEREQNKILKEVRAKNIKNALSDLELEIATLRKKRDEK